MFTGHGNAKMVKECDCASFGFIGLIALLLQCLLLQGIALYIQSVSQQISLNI